MSQTTSFKHSLSVLFKHKSLQLRLNSEDSSNAIAPLVFDGTNYRVWVDQMEAYLDANDQWEVVENEYKVPPLPDNPTMAQIKNHKEVRQRKSNAKASLFVVVS